MFSQTLGFPEVKAICKGLRPKCFSQRSLEHYAVCVCLRWTGHLPRNKWNGRRKNGVKGRCSLNIQNMCELVFNENLKLFTQKDGKTAINFFGRATCTHTCTWLLKFSPICLTPGEMLYMYRYSIERKHVYFCLHLDNIYIYMSIKR